MEPLFPLRVAATQQGGEPTIAVRVIESDSTSTGSLTSPFLFEVPGNEGVWFEWVSPDRVVIDWPSLNGGFSFRYTLTRVP